MGDGTVRSNTGSGDGVYRADDGPVSIWSPDTPLPVFATLEGRDVALVDGGEYRALIAMRDAVPFGAGPKAEPGVVGTGSSNVPLRATFPMRVNVLGVDAFVVPAIEYHRLIRPVGAKTAKGRANRLTLLDKDAELRQFFLERLGSQDVDSIREAAIERYGASRVPSRSAVYRFTVRAHGERKSA